MFQPVKLEYEEDQLRADFFGDHPWELARPRQVLEDDGKDYQRLNWSRLEQPTKQLDGERCVDSTIVPSNISCLHTDNQAALFKDKPGSWV